MPKPIDDAKYHDVCRWLAIRCVYPGGALTTLQTLHRDYDCWSAAQPGKGDYQRRALKLSGTQYHLTHNPPLRSMNHGLTESP